MVIDGNREKMMRFTPTCVVVVARIESFEFESRVKRIENIDYVLLRMVPYY